MFSLGKKSVVIVLILFVLIAVVGWAWRQRESLPFVAKPLQMAAAPFEYGASRIMNSLASAFHIVDISLKNRIEWEALERENAELKSRTVDYDELVAENDRLRQLLDFRASHGQYQMVAAVVISRDYGTWSNTMIIDAGTNEGVAKDMPVITPSGVVGFISEAYPHSARVQLLTDPRTSIGAIVQRPESRVSSVVRGNGNVPSEPQFVNIAKDADILEGDTLVTSGFGSIYPKGLYVGTIVSIHQNDNDFVKYAVIRPSVDFSKLEEVFVILKSSDTGSYDKPGVAPKLVPQTNRDKVEGIKGAAAL
ncbi:rod shape-determining protein MreC [Megasphaera sp. ASD88]|uniref:rod shape-determining protein MreC n=1 Tax=Megasphaera TaxID=906 RepID=UPI0008207900|nr:MULTISPECIES: rod shape-determining protein MreC [Megasphaera]SCJ64545.1 rod shape-determining protein MreC [uncultured Ruminococcus sp.]MCU6715535.1 rod shape-determining protein MreC [Megasphaera butyrica]OUO47371.1 rod shape-determining protein MreC [Megasphaera sp. An286]PAV38884.1 rod shape-determining protein MreC [Megasphaera sp. ASD88]SCI13505.1 rod shape-determining protein MreC [uncultured Megasphaera sp.]